MNSEILSNLYLVLTIANHKSRCFYILTHVFFNILIHLFPQLFHELYIILDLFYIRGKGAHTLC